MGKTYATICKHDNFKDECPECGKVSSSPPPDVVEAARRTLQRFSELGGEAWKDIQEVCKWVIAHGNKG